MDLKQYTVTAEVENGTVDSGTEAKITKTVNHGGSETFTFTANKGYALESVTVDGTNVALSSLNANGEYTFSKVVADGHSIKVVYAEDRIGTTDPDGGDGIPDSHQATLIYTISNGTWAVGGSADQTVVVTLEAMNEQGEWTQVSNIDRRIPTGMTANEGYTGGAWNANPAEETLEPERTYRFAYSYSRTPPDPITPLTDPGTGGGGTPIPDPPTPLDPGTDIPDEEVPLANAVGLNDVDHFAYVIGYDDDTVRPLNNITRAEAVTILFRLMTDEYRAANWSTENSFSDVNVGNWYNKPSPPSRRPARWSTSLRMISSCPTRPLPVRKSWP